MTNLEAINLEATFNLKCIPILKLSSLEAFQSRVLFQNLRLILNLEFQNGSSLTVASAYVKLAGCL